MIIVNKEIAIIANIALEYLMVLSIINMCIMSNWTKILRIVDAYLLCVLNPIVQHCDMWRYSAIYCISDIIDMWKAYPSFMILAIYWNIAQPYTVFIVHCI